MKRAKQILAKHAAALIAVILILLAALGCGFKSDDEWKRSLGHKKLSRAKTSGSISDKTNIWFCPSGEYAMQTQFSGFSPGGGGTLSMADEEFEFGRWRVEDSTLIMQSESGKIREYALSPGMDSTVINLDGGNYLVTSHGECR